MICLNEILDNTNLVIQKVYVTCYEDEDTDTIVGDSEYIAICTKNIESIEYNENIYTHQGYMNICIEDEFITDYISFEDASIIDSGYYKLMFFRNFYNKNNKIYVKYDELKLFMLLSKLMSEGDNI